MKPSHFTSFAFGFFVMIVAQGVWTHNIEEIFCGVFFSIISFLATSGFIGDNL